MYCIFAQWRRFLLEIGGTFSGKSNGWGLVGVWELAPRENFEIYVNADANFSISRPNFWHLIGTHKTAILSTRHFVSMSVC